MNNPVSANLRFCRIVLLLIPLFLGVLSAEGQVHGEYFWNSDPGIGRATKMTYNGESDGYQNFTLDASGLRPGVNMLGMRAFSGGRWSHTRYDFVVFAPEEKTAVWSGEYFWDTDPGVGKGISIPSGAITDGTTAAELSASGLDAGTHTLGLRVNSGGTWSHTRTYIVAVPADPLLENWRAEYFWDTDPGVGKATPLTISAAQDAVIVDTDILAEHLSSGRHTIGFRTCSGRTWSQTVIAEITVPDNRKADIIGAEYFWGEDPGFGKGTPIAVDKGNDVAVEINDIDFPQTVADEYVLSFRARSTEGWGVTYVRVIPHLYVESIELTADSERVCVDKTMRINAEVTPADAFNADLQWSSSDEGVATVSSDGTVTGVAPGNAIVTAASTDGSNITATYNIVVGEESGIGGVEAERPEITVDGSEIIVTGVPEGEIVTVIAPSGATVYSGTKHRIRGLATGIYIVIVNSMAEKVVLR